MAVNRSNNFINIILEKLIEESTDIENLLSESDTLINICRSGLKQNINQNDDLLNDTSVDNINATVVNTNNDIVDNDTVNKDTGNNKDVDPDILIIEISDTETKELDEILEQSEKQETVDNKIEKPEEIINITSTSLTNVDETKLNNLNFLDLPEFKYDNLEITFDNDLAMNKNNQFEENKNHELQLIDIKHNQNISFDTVPNDLSITNFLPPTMSTPNVKLKRFKNDIIVSVDINTTAVENSVYKVTRNVEDLEKTLKNEDPNMEDIEETLHNEDQTVVSRSTLVTIDEVGDTIVEPKEIKNDLIVEFHYETDNNKGEEVEIKLPIMKEINNSDNNIRCEPNTNVLIVDNDYKKSVKELSETIVTEKVQSETFNVVISNIENLSGVTPVLDVKSDIKPITINKTIVPKIVNDISVQFHSDEIITETFTNCETIVLSNEKATTSVKRLPETIVSNTCKKLKYDIPSFADDNFDESYLDFTQVIFESQKTLDENNPNWQDINELNTVEEYFNFVSKVWQSNSMPNPHENLTKRFVQKPPKQNKTKDIKESVVSIDKYYNNKVNYLANEINKKKNYSTFDCFNRFPNRNSIGKDVNELNNQIYKIKDDQNDQHVINKYYSNKDMNAQFVTSTQYKDIVQQDIILQKIKTFY